MSLIKKITMQLCIPTLSDTFVSTRNWCTGVAWENVVARGKYKALQMKKLEPLSFLEIPAETRLKCVEVGRHIGGKYKRHHDELKLEVKSGEMAGIRFVVDANTVNEAQLHVVKN